MPFGDANRSLYFLAGTVLYTSMNLLEARNKINSLMSVFVTQVKGATVMGQTDINRVAEMMLIPLFAEVYGFKALKNLNTDKDNHPAIDLGDETAKVCVQVTSTSDIEKVKSSLRKFVEYKFYEKYDRLIVYILTEKQKSYSSKAFTNIIQGKFKFDSKKDIQDSSNLLKVVAHFSIDKVEKVKEILEANIEGKTRLLPSPEEHKTETTYLNLVKISFPKTLYTADLAIQPQFSSADRGKSSGRRNSAPREIVQEALAKQGLKFGVDWEYFKRRIITFHDLNNSDLPLAKIVNRETITEINTQEFFDKGEEHEKTFKSLLRRCLQQKLYQQQVLWQYKEQLFIFGQIEEESERKEHWFGERAADRVVYERFMKKEKPLETSYCKHLAFKIQFKRFGGDWYILIKPEWFFSYDGYKKSSFNKDRADWLKKRENNNQVFNHLRFITYFLGNSEPLQITKRTYPFLSFGQLLSFDSSPLLNDYEWNPPKKEEEEDFNDIQDLPLFKYETAPN
ncbi:SMEK domain-containing protein [Pseudanabaena sp. PCC 6802]|uniref:SMEK domain-containing protein n=1 Tax=Pseudanabaena sp. PCC 6802 TaxID=118173 RepID=UPI0012EA5937|nr:SMEK domain-containing protein [Pseudanabaena sp. PCC 6802]